LKNIGNLRIRQASDRLNFNKSLMKLRLRLSLNNGAKNRISSSMEHTPTLATK